MNAIIMGIGPNSLEIPLVLCESEEAAKQYLANIGLTLNSRGEYEIDEEPSESVAKGLFKHYYYFGCGACYEVQVRPAPFNTPLVPWDLD